MAGSRQKRIHRSTGDSQWEMQTLKGGSGAEGFVHLSPECLRGVERYEYGLLTWLVKTIFGLTEVTRGGPESLS